MYLRGRYKNRMNLSQTSNTINLGPFVLFMFLQPLVDIFGFGCITQTILVHIKAFIFNIQESPSLTGSDYHHLAFYKNPDTFQVSIQVYQESYEHLFFKCDVLRYVINHVLQDHLQVRMTVTNWSKNDSMLLYWKWETPNGKGGHIQL